MAVHPTGTLAALAMAACLIGASLMNIGTRSTTTSTALDDDQAAAVPGAIFVPK